MLDDLILASSLVLYKFSEGCEDWSEWDELAKRIDSAACDESVNHFDRKLAQLRVKDFWYRQRKLLDNLES